MKPPRYTLPMLTLRPFASLLLFTCIASSISLAAQAQSPSASPAKADWKDAIAQRREALITKNGPGTDAQLRAELLKMRDADQKARGVDPTAKAKGHVEVATNLAAIDDSLTKELQLIVKGRGWPTISMVGIDASNAAMLIMTHTRDHAWQVSLLPMLTNLADRKQIDGSALALVIDKELVFEGKLQRYGTQFKQMDDGSIAMYSVEDPGGLDRERAEVMLPPIDVYKTMMSQMYHLKVSSKIVMATPQKP
jgi:hypothetical protein